MLEDLVKRSRSYRGYDESRKVTRDELMQMIACARLTPSSVNAQPFKYFLANEEEVVAGIQACTKWAAALPELEIPHKGKYPTAFIAICQDKQISDALARFQKDIGIVAQTILLKATEMGLGGCMIGNFNAEQVRKVAGVSEQYAPVLVLAIGKPDETIILTDVAEDGNTGYYRDGQDVHYVPKRSLEELIL